MQSCGGWIRKEKPRRAVKANSRRAAEKDSVSQSRSINSALREI